MSTRGRARTTGARSESIKPSLVPRPLPVEKNVSSPPSGLGTRLGTRPSRTNKIGHFRGGQLHERHKECKMHKLNVTSHPESRSDCWSRTRLGYFRKPSKTFLVVKTECRAAATEEFEGTGVQITEDGDDLAHKAGQRHLGAAVGSPEFVAAYLDEKVATWVEQVTHLADIATTQPHAAYAGFVFGLRHRWTFIQRTMPTAGDHMQPLKDEIDHKLLPTLVKHESNDLELDLMRLPARFGGMSFDDPVVDSGRKHADSIANAPPTSHSRSWKMGLISCRASSWIAGGGQPCDNITKLR